MKVRRISITKQIVIIMLTILLIGDAVLAIVTISKSNAVVMSEIKASSRNLASMGAALIDRDDFLLIEPGCEGTDYYNRVYEALTYVRDYTDAMYVYSLKMVNNEVVFAVDTDPDDPGGIMEPYDAYDTIYEAFTGEPVSDNEATTDQWGVYISSYAPIIDDNGSVIGVVGVDIDFADIQAKQKAITLTVIALCGVFFAVLLVVLFLLARKLRGSFSTLNDNVRALADGSGNLSKEIDIHSGDEFEVIGESFNLFIAEVRNLVSQVAGTSYSNTDTLRDINNGILDVSANMEECSATGETVSNNLSYTAGEVVSLAGEVGDVKAFAEKANKAAAEAAKTATKHEQKASEKIERLKVNIENALEEAKSVERIKQIASEIQGIATQTRLLSLNAQIEASHAGLSGRGFAVVATEVHELSDKITEAVDEIDAINNIALAAMEHVTEGAMELTDFMSKDVAEDYRAYAELGEEYGRSILEIRDYMLSLKKRSDDISQAVAGADTNLKEISKSVTDSANRIEKISNSSSQIYGSMNDLLEIPILKLTNEQS